VKDTVELGKPQKTMWRMRIACWITKATHKHTHTFTHNMSCLLLFHCNNGYANALLCYVLLTLPALFKLPLGQKLSNKIL